MAKTEKTVVVVHDMPKRTGWIAGKCCVIISDGANGWSLADLSALAKRAGFKPSDVWIEHNYITEWCEDGYKIELCCSPDACKVCRRARRLFDAELAEKAERAERTRESAA